MTRTSMDPGLDSGRRQQSPTNEAPSLFDAPPSPSITWPAPSVPVDTSEAAADALTATAQGRARRRAAQLRVLDIVARQGGATIDEVDAITGMGTGTICPRVDEMRAAGWLETTIEKRATRKGSAARVHTITPLGRTVLAQEACE